MKFKQFVILIVVTFVSQSFSGEFNVGDGASYKMIFDHNSPKVDLNIYISHSSFNKLGVEYHFASANSIIPTEMWQQFNFGLGNTGNDKAGLRPTEGYVLTGTSKKPEKLTSDYLNVNDGVQLCDFLFKSINEINADNVITELIETPAGVISADKYRKERNGQVVYFWISEAARPIGLVKLKSEGKKLNHNYEIELTSILKNVKAAIDSNKAIPLSHETKMKLPKPI